MRAFQLLNNCQYPGSHMEAGIFLSLFLPRETLRVVYGMAQLLLSKPKFRSCA